MNNLTRRELLLTVSAATTAARAATNPPPVDPRVVERNDRAVATLVRNQITDAGSPRRGSVPDEFNLPDAQSAGELIETLAASFIHPQSRFHHEKTLIERMQLAATFLERSQSQEGNIDLLSTNFNSPPDTGFLCHHVASAAAIASRYDIGETVGIFRPFLLKAAQGMSVGGIHTPNHRWVVSSALAQINELFPNPSYVSRIDQWLAEGIDIDEDGQYIERSTGTYNTVIDRALVVMAVKLSRPALLEPVRRNLHAMLYLLHPDGEVVTDVSGRQDRFIRATMSGYWFCLNYLAVRDDDGELAGLVRQMTPDHARLSTVLEFPELVGALPKSQPLPDNFERSFPSIGITRIRRGRLDVTMVQDSSHFFSLRNGAATVNAVRFASSFFGKGQFVPAASRKEGESYVFRQSLQGQYYQPLDPPQRVTYKNWGALKASRRQSEICRLEQTATITEQKGGFELRVKTHGTNGVPVAVEINLREGGTLEGCRPAEGQTHAWILDKGFATYHSGNDRIRFGPGAAPHSWLELRGAEPKPQGEAVYVTGYSPFDHTIYFECT